MEKDIEELKKMWRESEKIDLSDINPDDDKLLREDIDLEDTLDLSNILENEGKNNE